MPKTIADVLYEQKFSEMQKYIPFLDRVIDKLKNNDQDKPRKAQLEKMQMLHNLLTNKQKKLKIDTLLKCETVLKKLHAKIEKSDELIPPKTISKTSENASAITTIISSDKSTNVQPNPQRSTLQHASISKTKSVPNFNNLIEINTCPASPTQFGDEDFRPPVEIPTERRCSPVRTMQKFPWEECKTQKDSIPIGSSRYQNRSVDFCHQQSSHDYPKSSHSRWSDSRDRVEEKLPDVSLSSSSAHHKSRSSFSSTSATAHNHRSHNHQRSEPKKVYSSEEENWDDPQDEIPPPKPIIKPPPPPPPQTLSSASHSQQREHRESNNNHQHRHHDKRKYNRDISPHFPPPFPPLPDISLEKDDYQKKLYHDTIYKYKKPDIPKETFNPFANIPQPEPQSFSTQPSNIFNRLGEKVDNRFQNFRIEVKNDKMKQKPQKSTPPPLLKVPPAIPIKPIDEVLKSPPLSADDIDDLLNESLEAANEKANKSKTINVSKDNATSALDIVRKKLAMISKAPQSGIESPPSSSISKDHEEMEQPFYRRGHTPTKKPNMPSQINSTSKYMDKELFKSPTALLTSAEPSPASPTNPTDPVIERLALKYHPHRKRDSEPEKAVIQSSPDLCMDPMKDRLALKYNPHPRRDSLATPLRTVDPRVGKIIGQMSPLVSSPIATSPVPNVLPAINMFDPRLRNARPGMNVDSMASSSFCAPMPFNPPIPSLMDINLNNTLPIACGDQIGKPSFCMPIQRVDPRAQKNTASVYAEKFNPERNDQTERIKYFESKKKKPPEPKTYGEYKQSKSRQQAAEEASKTDAVSDIVPPVVTTTPSTLDKMYRNAQYDKELGGNISGFKIPKKPKPDEPKITQKNEETVKEPENLSKELQKTTELEDCNQANDDECNKKADKSSNKCDQNEKVSKQLDHSKESKRPVKTKETVVEKDAPEQQQQTEPKEKLNAESINVTAEENLEDSLNSSTTSPGRRPGRPRSAKKGNSVPRAEVKDEDSNIKIKTDPEENVQEEEDDEIKPRRIRTRRLTILKDQHDEEDAISPSSPPTRCRSASDIFSPTTDNSVVSTQNIISGKRKTRASINFNEKATKKPTTPKTTPVISSIPKTSTPKSVEKLVPKLEAKKSTPVNKRNRRQSVKKQQSDDGQICAVSSTTSQSGDVFENHNDESLAGEELESPEEPSSSGSKSHQPLVADVDENQKKQVWLEGFLKSIVDPSTNKDCILDMLKAVLDDKKLQQVKNILYSTESEENDNSMNAKKTDQEQNKPRVTRTKKNELDRLNEDIRDMFICQGVVTATGRRMCTLAKETSHQKPTKSKEQKESREQPKERKTRSKGEISTDASSPTTATKRKMRRAKVLISPLNIRALRSQNRVPSRPPEMPVLEPNTPIKLPEEYADESNNVKEMKPPIKKKPGPKSKCAPSLLLESDEEDDNIELVHLKKKIKGDQDIIQKKEKCKEIVQKAVIKEEIVSQDGPDKKEIKKLVKPSPQEVQIPKNINPMWHSMSDYSSCCIICQEKTRHIAPHYLSAHNDSEVYISRLPPNILEEFKQNKGNRALYSLAKKQNLTSFHYRCPFCFFQSTTTLRSWIEHFTTHTGEYQYKCSACFKAMNGCSHLMEHIKKCRADAKKLCREQIKLKEHAVSGYVCHLCNFIQMLHSGVVRHLSHQHNLEDEQSIARIIQIKLIDALGVPKMDEDKETTMVSDEILSPASKSASTNDHELMKAPKESNIEVFLSRKMSSPTSDVLTERLKSIDQDEGMTSDSSVNTTVVAKEGQATGSRITIAERLSQRFKNIEKQNMLEGGREEIVLAESRKDPEPEVATDPLQMETQQSVSEAFESEPALSTAKATENTGCPSINSSFNESGRLVIDEQEGTVDDNGSESEWADDNNDEDDNENWEDIEITETKGASQKDKNKNKSIFQTLSRLYASIAPKKRTKKHKEKETKKADVANTEKSTQDKVKQTEEHPSASVSKPAPQSRLPPPQISNLSELLPDSPSDSLDMLLATNFNCLEGDGTSFPHLDLNDLDSPIFLLSEEQTNLQDAIAMATDMEHIKYDVLGNPLSAASVQTRNPAPSSAGSLQRIGNFGFSFNGDTLKYYCMVTACTFLFSDHPDGLQNHYLQEHSALQWNGFCHSCNAQVCSDGSREIQHMLDFHSKPKTVDQAVEKPRIKFRRLTGDILSTGKQSAQQVPPVHKELSNNEATEMSLTTLLQSEPRAMNQPAPPPAFGTDIPLYKNVSKEFAITGVAEGVSDDDLRNLVLNQAESTPGGMQISQVVSLNSRAIATSPAPKLPDLMPAFNDGNSAFQTVEKLPQRNSPAPIQINLPICFTVPPSNPGLVNLQSQRNSPVQTNLLLKQHTYKCCATNCQFSTNLQTVMNEHIAFHMRTDYDRGSLKCNECAYAARNITDYFQHVTRSHIKPTSNATSIDCNVQSTNELTEKIQNILRSSTNSNESTEGEEADSMNLNNRLGFFDRLKKVAQEMVAETGIADDKIWKCPECTTIVPEQDFLTHVSNHIRQCLPNRAISFLLHCPHCTSSYHRPMALKAHMKNHARHQYFCHVCSATFSNFQQAQKHVQETHMRFSIVHSQSLIPDTVFGKSTFYLVSTKKLMPVEVMQFGEKLVADCERKTALNKTHFKPHEQYLLPLQPIFNNQVFCSVCNYKTKVRTNMYRHLQLHKQEVDVASVDPVNPVPCLEKNEKHFDKMLNLACSSNTSGAAKSKDTIGGSVNMPTFVPDMRRFVCGHPGCTYLTISDQMLRSHLNALHCGEKGYRCPHCQEDICKKSLCAERIVQHLRFHGSKIFQCGECDYLHYTKYVVERHIHDKHSTLTIANLISYDRTEREVKKTAQPVVGKGVLPGLSSFNGSETREQTEAISSASPSNKCKWECALCKHQTVTWNQMISHAHSAHRAKHQYHCVHCTFGSAHLAHIMDHIDTKHPTKTREAKYMFYKINETPQDKAADTRPLWSRDDPKRVRSIRGILMENEEDAERTKQSLSNAGVDLDDDDDDVEIVHVIESESTLKPGALGCFHCNYTTEDMSSLTGHWKAKHWHVKNDEIVPQSPFFFRIHSSLKCPQCSFVGDCVSLQLHVNKKHQRLTFWAADPKLLNTCGHCPFEYNPNRLESLSRHYQREHKPTDVKNLSSTMLKRMLALGECQVYMQCYFCAEICPDKTAIIEHERMRHGSANFRYKQIKDEVIYRCAMCQYSSTNEMATLRHMIDHSEAFKYCHFCKADQINFNSYMQHCYSCHSKELKNFKQIYPLADMTFFLGQMLLIFPNGLILNKKNLLHTQYGSTERINAMYDEICKKALEPPIPPLCMARLMAKKSIEAREASSLLPPPPVPVTAKRIAKRRSTVALGTGDHSLSDFTSHTGPQKIKKRKSSICVDRPQPPAAPLFSTIVKTSMMYDAEDQQRGEIESKTVDPSEGVSHYRKQPEPVDLSKIYTQIAIGDKFAPVSIKKFALLFKMNAKVVVEKMNFKNYKKRNGTINKPCPASRKQKRRNQF